jgi:hypothetical protein
MPFVKECLDGARQVSYSKIHGIWSVLILTTLLLLTLILIPNSVPNSSPPHTSIHNYATLEMFDDDAIMLVGCQAVLVE